MVTLVWMMLVACSGGTQDSGKQGDSIGDSNGGTTDTSAGLSCNTENEDCGPGVSGCFGEGPEMLPGADCIACHSPGNFEEDEEDAFFSIAGTVFSNVAGTAPLVGATVRITDATGSVVTLESNSVGNFYSKQTVTPPLTAEVEVDGNVRAMASEVSTGACNSCHTCEGAADGKLAGPQ